MLSLWLAAQGNSYFAETVHDDANDDQDYMDYATVILHAIKDISLRNKVETKFKKLELC